MRSIQQYWVGEGVGVLVTMPLMWMLLDESWTRPVAHGRVRGV
jgi:hypothetical protein